MEKPFDLSSKRKFSFGFTLLEFLVASFLGTLLLVLVYQAFSQVARHYLLLRDEEALSALMEVRALRYQLTHLYASPYLRDGRLVLPVNSPVGPLLAIYDLEAGFYAEEVGFKDRPSEELKYVFKGVGLKEIKLFLLEPPEAKEISPENPWPKGKPLLLLAHFVDGPKTAVAFMVPETDSAQKKEGEKKTGSPQRPPANPFKRLLKGL